MNKINDFWNDDWGEDCWVDDFIFYREEWKTKSNKKNETSSVQDIVIDSEEKTTINRGNIPYKKIIVNVASTFVGLITMLSPVPSNFANAKDKNYTKTVEVIYSQKTQVINGDDDPSALNFPSKSFLVRKSQRAQIEELEAQGKIFVKKRKMACNLYNCINSQLEKEKQSGKAFLKSILVNQNEEKLNRLKLIQQRNIENARKYANFILEPNKAFFEKKFLKGPILPMITKTKQIEKQLKKEIVKEETFKRNLLKFENGQRKHYVLNKLIILIFPLLETLYPILCVNNKDKTKTKLILAIEEQNINIKRYVKIIKLRTAVEKRRNIQKLVENYQTIMLFSLLMSVYQLQFNSSGRLVKSSEAFKSVETQIEEWIMENKILVYLIICSTMTFLTMKILDHIQSNKQEYFLYLLKLLEILRKQFILPNMVELFKDSGKKILSALIFNFFLNIMLSRLTLPVTLNFEFNSDQNDISLNIDFDKKDNHDKNNNIKNE